MENNSQNHISVVKKSSLNLYELSLESSSNTLSYNLLDDVWCSNNKLFNREAENHIFDSTTNILEKADTNQKNIWKTALSKIDPISLLERSMATCANGCYDQEYVGLEQFKKNECQCIKNTSSRAFNDVTKENKIPNSVIGKNKGALSISEADRSLYDRHSLKHKFGKEIPINVDTPSNLSKNYKDVDWDKEEEAEKAHKSNVAKITFKTAKDQLLASNPAARRVLGTSRKAQGKFVSPMIGTNIDKQELEPGVSDDRLKNIDAKMIELIENEIIDRGTPVAWEDIAGLQLAKSVIQEAVVWPLLRPDIFTGLRRPPKGILLFGPPGTGKTLIGKCVAAQCQATFFNISASSLTSKWIGDGEKMVRALFTVARTRQPAVIFIDEIDSLLTQRSDSEHEASRRLKTEFLVQLDGAATGEDERVLVVGATNRPHELDEAARRRLVKRLYIPLPEHEARAQMISSLLRGERHSLSAADVAEVSVRAAGYSGADVRALCEEAALGPVRAVPLHKIHTIHTQEVRPLCLQDFINALQRVKPTVSQDDLSQYVKWNETFGQGF